MGIMCQSCPSEPPGVVSLDCDQEWLVGNYIEWTRENSLYCREHRPGYRAHCHSELQLQAFVVAKTEETWKGTTSSPFLAGVVVPAIYR
jgi:hypothetical protein